MRRDPAPQVSVVIACKNAADTIPLQLRALAHQEGAEAFEVIVANNGSCDDLHGAVLPFMDALDLRVVDASHRAGAAYARNVGVRAARGEYILFCDADDMVGPRWVSAMSAQLRAADVVVTGPIYPWSDGEPTVPEPSSDQMGPLVKGNYLPTAGGGNSAYRRSTLAELGGMDMGFRGGCEDVDLSWRAQETGRALRFADEAVLFYRPRPDRAAGYTQHYRWNREDVRLWSLGAQRGHDSRMVSVKGSVVRLRQVPALVRGMRRNPVEAATLGCIMGSLAGHARYRVPGHAPVPDLMPSEWFDEGGDSGHGMPASVTFLANSMSAPNGVVTAVDNLANAFSQRGVAVRILSWGDADPDFVERHDLIRLRPWHRFTTHMRGFEESNPVLKPVRRALTPLVMRAETVRARRILRDLPQDGMIIAAGMECLEYVASLAQVPAPCVMQVHSAVASLSDEQVARLERCAEWADRVTVFTEEDVRALRRLGLENGVAIPNVAELQHTGASQRRSSVVFAGRLEPLKQVDHIMRAFVAAAPREWTLDIYGVGPLESELKTLAGQLCGTIVFHGYVRKPSEIFGDASINVMASQYEGLPTSVVEAAAHGVPTITYASSPGTVLAVGDHGVCVPLGDEGALAGALAAMMSDPGDLAARSARAAHDRRFEADTVVAQWRRLWLEAAGERGMIVPGRGVSNEVEGL